MVTDFIPDQIDHTGVADTQTALNIYTVAAKMHPDFIPDQIGHIGIADINKQD